MIKQLCMLNNPILKKPCEDITDDQFNTQNLYDIITDMKDTMLKFNGIGLALPQIGISKKIIIFLNENQDNKINTSLYPIITMINPTIYEHSGSIEGIEGCLSYPKIFKKIRRPDMIKVIGFDVEGKMFDEQFTGWTARIICHEIDHLNGICKVGNKK